MSNTGTRRLAQLQAHLSPTMSSDAIFFGHECVNRVSFLREDSAFIEKAVKHATTRFVVLKNGVVYGVENDRENGDAPSVWYATYAELQSEVDAWCVMNAGEGVPLDALKITFMGLDELEKGVEYRKYGGVAYFGIEIGDQADLLKKCDEKAGLKTYDNRNVIFKLSNFDSSNYSHAKMYLDWLNRYRFCAGCGSKNLAIHAGTKLVCSSSKDSPSPCPVKSASVSNSSFPRTDCVVITAVTTRSFDKILLARGKRFPGPMYSCVAGFMEPSETVEAASLREVWEETGVKGQTVDIVQTQPWPYPANLMIGCIVYVECDGTNEVIDLGHDPELADAKWVETAEVKRVLNGGEADWFIPPATAIAHSLIKHCVDHFEAGKTK